MRLVGDCVSGGEALLLSNISSVTPIMNSQPAAQPVKLMAALLPSFKDGLCCSMGSEAAPSSAEGCAGSSKDKSRVAVGVGDASSSKSSAGTRTALVGFFLELTNVLGLQTILFFLRDATTCQS